MAEFQSLFDIKQHQIALPLLTIDHRGSWVRKEVILVEKDKIREHVESYKPYVSHYT